PVACAPQVTPSRRSSLVTWVTEPVSKSWSVSRAPASPLMGAEVGGAAEAEAAGEGPESPPWWPKASTAATATGSRPAAAMAIVGVLRHRGHRDPVHRPAHLRSDRGELGARRRQVRLQGVDLTVATEGRDPGEALEEHAAQRVDVGAPVDHLAADLLGRGVVEGPDEEP